VEEAAEEKEKETIEYHGGTRLLVFARLPNDGNNHRSCSLHSRLWQSSIFIIFRVRRFLSFQYH